MPLGNLHHKGCAIDMQSSRKSGGGKRRFVCRVFIQPIEGGEYFNFEFNILGYVKASHRIDRANSTRLEPADIARIKREPVYHADEPFVFENHGRRYLDSHGVDTMVANRCDARTRHEVRGEFPGLLFGC